MALEPIGDIGVSGFGTVDIHTWEGADEWDGATDEEGVVHADIGDRLPEEIQLGYDPSTWVPHGSGMTAYLPLDEEGESTATDYSGTGNDGSIQSGITQGADGILSSTSFDFSNTSNYVNLGNEKDGTLGGTEQFTVLVWMRATGGRNDYVADRYDTTSGYRSWYLQASEAMSVNVSTDGDNFYSTDSHGSMTIGEWYLLGFSYDDGHLELFINDGVEYSADAFSSGALHDADEPTKIGEGGQERPYEDRIDEFMVWTEALSLSDVQSIYNAGLEGYLETSTKSFSSSSRPNLQNLDYELRGETIELDVVGSPGTASEEVVTQVLDGAETYSLTWADSHTDFLLRPNLITADKETSPVFRRGELAG